MAIRFPCNTGYIILIPIDFEAAISTIKLFDLVKTKVFTPTAYIRALKYLCTQNNNKDYTKMCLFIFSWPEQSRLESDNFLHVIKNVDHSLL